MLVLSLCADCLMALPATAMAYPPSNNTVYSVRSFPATTTTRRDLTRESVSTDVQSDSDWGGIENLIVPQTKSQAEKDAEAKAQQEEETRKQAQEQAARGLPVTVTAATYWLWNILGSLIIVGPFIYTYKLLHAMNDLCADYNARG